MCIYIYIHTYHLGSWSNDSFVKSCYVLFQIWKHKFLPIHPPSATRWRAVQADAVQGHHRFHTAAGGRVTFWKLQVQRFRHFSKTLHNSKASDYWVHCTEKQHPFVYSPTFWNLVFQCSIPFWSMMKMWLLIPSTLRIFWNYHNSLGDDF